MLFGKLKALNLLKKHFENQEASSILRLGFAFSKWPYLHRAYLVTVCECNQTFIPVCIGNSKKDKMLLS